MDTTEIQTRIDALAARLVEKGVKIPEVEFDIKTGGSFKVVLRSDYSQKFFNGEYLKCLKSADTPEGAFDIAREYIDNLVGEDEQERRKFQHDLADVIDQGHALNMPDDVMAPLREGSQALTENLLTYDREAV